AAAGCGGSFTGTARLQDKESDRVRVMAEELAKFGIQSRTGPDRFTVLPGKLRAPKKPLTGHGDHRVVMALAILLIKTGGVIRGAEAISKSDPMFFDRLKALGIQIEEERNTL
ncbi:MAG: 3-phosphoshikimate 1-carboxyvinyltransferase, partial [Firmicutes bacterium]|nr:3-phosphoshikimate 1-carboxyvinyltransferase [Bacillota bacterium]